MTLFSGSKPHRKGHVVVLTGSSSYGVLSFLSTDLAGAFARSGYTAEVLDLTRVSIPTELRRIAMENRTDFFCAFSGYGANLEDATGQLLYDSLQIPYVGLMLDMPCYFPSRHFSLSPNIILLHGDDKHHEISLAISPDGSHRGLFRLAVASVEKELTHLAKRENTILFPSKGGDPAKYLRKMRDCMDSSAMKHALEIAEALQIQIKPLGQKEASSAWDLALSSGKYSLTDSKLHSIVMHADHLARIRKATEVARGLLTLPVKFIGGEWDHIQSASQCAKFLPGMPLPDIRRLMESSSFVLNVQPGTTHSIHDRFLLGTHSGAAVVSDSNGFIDSNIGHGNFVLWDGYPNTIADCVADSLKKANSQSMQELASGGLQISRTHFAIDNLAKHIISVVDAHRYGERLPSPDFQVTQPRRTT